MFNYSTVIIDQFIKSAMNPSKKNGKFWELLMDLKKKQGKLFSFKTLFKIEKERVANVFLKTRMFKKWLY